MSPDALRLSGLRPADAPVGRNSEAYSAVPTAAAWLDALRAACTSDTQSNVASRIGYSTTVVNQILKGTYNGDLLRVQAAIEGALLHAEVECPIAGLIPRQRCIEYQRRPFTPTNPMSVQLYRACRGSCPHSLIAKQTGKPETVSRKPPKDESSAGMAAHASRLTAHEQEQA